MNLSGTFAPLPRKARSAPSKNPKGYKTVASPLLIIMLSATLDVPEKALKLVDAFIAKDRLASHLLPAIAQLHGGGSPPRSWDA